MLGKKHFEPKLFYSVQMDQLVPPDHELRRILALVDFGYIRSQVKDKYSHTGQPSVDPEVILKLLFLGYYYGVLSERALMKRSQTDLAFRWFLGYDFDESIPTHSVLSKARSRYGIEAFQSVFERIVEQCIEAGLVEGKQAFLDATLIEANAAKSSAIPRMKVLNPVQYTEAMLPEEEPEKPSEPPDPPEKPKANDRIMSRTDPEATYRSEPDKKSGFYYEGHYLIDGKARVITAVTASPTNDSTADHAPELLMKARFRHRLLFESFCADAEYGTQGLYHFLFQQEITPFIPAQGPKGAASPFRKEHFTYEPEKDLYRCPEGQELEWKSYDASKKRSIYRPVQRGICQDCDFKKECAPGKGDRGIRRLLYQEAVDRAKEINQRAEYAEQMRLRKTLIEPLFGEAKDLHGLRRARSRGLARVKIQVIWTATVLNIKRLLRATQWKGCPKFISLSSLTEWWNQWIQKILTSLFNCQRTSSWSFTY